MTIHSLDTIIEESIFQNLKEIIKFFPEIETELNYLCTNLKQKFIDNGYDQIFIDAQENNTRIQILRERIEERDYDIDSLRGEIDDLENKIYSLEQENNNLSISINSLESQVEDLQADVYTLSNPD